MSPYQIDSTLLYEAKESDLLWDGRWAWTWNYDMWTSGVLLVWVIMAVAATWAIATWFEATERVRRLYCQSAEHINTGGCMAEVKPKKKLLPLSKSTEWLRYCTMFTHVKPEAAVTRRPFPADQLGLGEEPQKEAWLFTVHLASTDFHCKIVGDGVADALQGKLEGLGYKVQTSGGGE